MKAKFSALLAAALLVLPTAAAAQPTPTDQAYLDDLYRFLQTQDATTYSMATQTMSPEQNIWAAKTFCQTFSAGVSPSDAYAAYLSRAIGSSALTESRLTDEMAYAVGLYGGTVMNLGASYYCPQYQLQVEQALQSL